MFKDCYFRHKALGVGSSNIDVGPNWLKPMSMLLKTVLALFVVLKHVFSNTCEFFEEAIVNAAKNVLATVILNFRFTYRY